MEGCLKMRVKNALLENIDSQIQVYMDFRKKGFLQHLMFGPGRELYQVLAYDVLRMECRMILGDGGNIMIIENGKQDEQ